MTIRDKKLYPAIGYLLKDINDNGETLEDGTYIPPYLCEIIYLGEQITTLEQAKELYEEVPFNYLEKEEQDEQKS